MSEHFLKICKVCKAVIAQCRCPGLKAVYSGICDLCMKDNNMIKPDNNLPDERSI